MIISFFQIPWPIVNTCLVWKLDLASIWISNLFCLSELVNCTLPLVVYEFPIRMQRPSLYVLLPHSIVFHFENLFSQEHTSFLKTSLTQMATWMWFGFKIVTMKRALAGTTWPRLCLSVFQWHCDPKSSQNKTFQLQGSLSSRMRRTVECQSVS